MAVMIGPAANFCLLGCLFVVVVVVVNTGTVRRKTFTHSLPSVYVCWSVCIGIPTLTLHPLSLFLSHAPQTNEQTHIQTDKYRCTAVCTPLFMCTSVYACKKNKYHCLYVHETSTCIPLFMRAEKKYMYTTVYACRKQVQVYHNN